MGLTRATLERQLERARAELAEWVDELKDSGVPESEHQADPRWRSLKAACRKIQTRLRSVGEIEAREVEAAQRKGGDGS